jgi:hypothetical protein
MTDDEWIIGDGFKMKRSNEWLPKRGAPSKDEQIKAILSGPKASYDLALEILGVKHMARHSYAEVFTVSRKEIDEYVKEHGLPKVWCDIPDHIWGEGLEFWEKDGKWHLYWLEKGQRHDEQIFADEQTARDALLNWILGMSGTGIDFTKRNESK